MEVVAQFVCPNAGCLHMHAKMGLVRRTSQGEGMILVRTEGRARQSNPLAGEILEIRRSREFQFRHVGRQQFGFQNVQLYVFGLQAENLIQCEDDRRYDEKYPKSGRLKNKEKRLAKHAHKIRSWFRLWLAESKKHLLRWSWPCRAAVSKGRTERRAGGQSRNSCKPSYEL